MNKFLHKLHRFFRIIAAEEESALWLGGSSEVTHLNRWSLMGVRPHQLIELQGDQLTHNGEKIRIDSQPALFEHLDRYLRQCQVWPEMPDLPFHGGLCGMLAYEFYRWCDPYWLSRGWPGDERTLVLCEFEDWLLVDLETAQLHVLSPDAQRTQHYQALWAEDADFGDEVHEGLTSNCSVENNPEAHLSTFTASLSQLDYEQAVERLKQAIAEGEIYQANLSMRFEKNLHADPFQLYEAICQRNPSPFSAFFKYPGGLILSNSPERLVQVDAAGRVQTRPIAGTRGRGKSRDEDESIGQTLQLNEKERAEHLMLVDLERNDLGRVCRAGTVQVDELMVLERYAHVTHLVSNVNGRLNPAATPWNVLKATFPGGTITGCPKLRCIEILATQEPVPRGMYTGSLGYIDALTNAMDWNILIRSLQLKPLAPLRYHAAIHAGAGIVHDSVGAYEYRECLRKATTLLQVLQSVERPENYARCTDPE